MNLIFKIEENDVITIKFPSFFFFFFFGRPKINERSSFFMQKHRKSAVYISTPTLMNVGYSFDFTTKQLACERHWKVKFQD